MLAVPKTTDGRPVADIFDCYDRYGVTLQTILEFQRERGVQVNWFEFLQRARSAGWNVKRKADEIAEEMRMVLGSEYTNAWRQRVAGVFGA